MLAYAAAVTAWAITSCWTVDVATSVSGVDPEETSTASLAAIKRRLSSGIDDDDPRQLLRPLVIIRSKVEESTSTRSRYLSTIE